MNINNMTREIVSGPNRDFLIDAFKYAYGEEKLTPSFEVVVGKITEPKGSEKIITRTVKVIHLTSIEHEDGSGSSFNLKGCCVAKIYLGGEEKVYDFESYYHARTRKGVMSFKER